jgi:hypothetical protein
MPNGLTVERRNCRITVFDSLRKCSAVYSVDADGILICESGFDHSQYRYAVRALLDANYSAASLLRSSAFISFQREAA